MNYILVRVTGRHGSPWTWILTDGLISDDSMLIASGSLAAMHAAQRLLGGALGKPDGLVEKLAEREGHW